MSRGRSYERPGAWFQPHSQPALLSSFHHHLPVKFITRQVYDLTFMLLSRPTHLKQNYLPSEAQLAVTRLTHLDVVAYQGRFGTGDRDRD